MLRWQKGCYTNPFCFLLKYCQCTRVDFITNVILQYLNTISTITSWQIKPSGLEIQVLRRSNIVSQRVPYATLYFCYKIHSGFHNFLQRTLIHLLHCSLPWWWQNQEWPAWHKSSHPLGGAPAWADNPVNTKKKRKKERKLDYLAQNNGSAANCC